MNPQVDNYLLEGCGRCALGGTPECKVHPWEQELKALRGILLQTDLTEELKWSVPCYTYHGANVLLLSALKDYVSIGFMKGALLKDPAKVLDKPGQNSQAVRQFRITELQQVIDLETTIKEYVQEAIEIEKSGKKIDFKAKNQLELTQELLKKFDEDPAFKTAFEALTPGRQRGYHLYFSAPKKPETRINRIEKFMPKIFEGKGFHDR